MATESMTLVPAKGDGPLWPAWLEELYVVADALDATGFAAAFGESGSMCFASPTPLVGSQAIEAALTEFFASVTSMAHRPINVVADKDSIIFESIVTYGRADGLSVEVPAASAYIRTADGGLHCRIYCDMAPVYAEA